MGEAAETERPVTTPRTADSPEHRHLLVAILIIDIVGSTDLRRSVGEAVATMLHEVCDRTMLAHVADHRGRTIRRTGDGVVAAFPSVVDAIDAMYSIARSLDSVDLDGRTLTVPIRSVIDVGDVDWSEQTPRGEVLDRAERIIDSLDGAERLLTPVAATMAPERSNLEFGAIDGTLRLLDDP